LKQPGFVRIQPDIQSPPVREAWIETGMVDIDGLHPGRLPCGRRGLKLCSVAAVR